MRQIALSLSALALLTACGDSNAPADVPADQCSGGAFAAAPFVPPGCMLVDIDLCNRRGRVVCPDAGADADTDAGADAMPDASPDACVLECAAPPPGCRYEGTVTCSPRNCGTLVCADAGADAPASDAPASDAPASDAPASDASASDAPAIDGAIVCGRSGEVFPTFRQECAGDADCVVAVHQTDCCGNQRGLGITASQRSAFDAAEAVCRPMYPRCGCPTRGILCDDDRWTLAADAVGVTCRAGRCSTFVR